MKKKSKVISLVLCIFTFMSIFLIIFTPIITIDYNLLPPELWERVKIAFTNSQKQLRSILIPLISVALTLNIANLICIYLNRIKKLFLLNGVIHFASIILSLSAIITIFIKFKNPTNNSWYQITNFSFVFYALLFIFSLYLLALIYDCFLLKSQSHQTPQPNTKQKLTAQEQQIAELQKQIDELKANHKTEE